jgi:hypothetical protein
MGSVVNGHRTCEADTIDQDDPEEDSKHSREEDSRGARSGPGGSRKHVDHRKPNPYRYNGPDRRDPLMPGQQLTNT